MFKYMKNCNPQGKSERLFKAAPAVTAFMDVQLRSTFVRIL